jgi:uncharacterized protein (DUF58 family)
MRNVLPFQNFIRPRFWQWVSRRSPKAKTVTLKHKSIYVLPTRQGLLFLVVLTAMWLLGTNYENNLILATTFLLISIFIVSILYTYRNLSGLHFKPVAAQAVFAGEQAEFTISVSSPAGATCENIRVSLNPATSAVVNLVDIKEQVFMIRALSHHRGWLEPGRMLVATTFPLGLMRAWSWIELEMSALIYPKPIECELAPFTQSSDHQGNLITRDNAEDFDGLNPYRPGANLSLVAWKHYARGAGLHTKEYVGYQSHDIWLDWNSLKGLDTEARLSRLSFWVLQLSKTSGLYGLRLPNQTVNLGTGIHHQQTLLRALALYDDKLGAARDISP